MGFLGKLFGKKEQDKANCYPPTRGNIKEVFVQPNESCYHQWREIKGGEWDEHRYGKHFEVASENSWYAYFRDVYRCPLCGGEVLAETYAMY